MISRYFSSRSPHLLLVAGCMLLLSFGCGEHSYVDAVDEAAPGVPPAGDHQSGDQHTDFGENDFIDAEEDDTATFGADVNAASYTQTRRALNEDRLPDPVSVRTEEFINFFQFDYDQPDGDDPFAVHTEVAPSHFGSTEDRDRQMIKIGLQGRDIDIDEMRPTNLVFLVDVSGSMSPQDRLPLAKESLQILLDHLRDTDTVGIQTYASGSETVLEPTPVENKDKIGAAIDSLQAGGSTWAEGGIVDAYNMAEDAFIEDGNNRVVILTDGDFNVGKTGDDLVDLINEYRDREISLTSVGYGHGNLNDATMERLARRGNGNYFYVDNEEEAQRIFGSNLPATVEIIAHDVRNQIQFNSDAVDRHRLVGYEKRVMDDEDFDDEEANGGEIGAGHSVTAFFELELHEEADEADELATVSVNHKGRYGDELQGQSHTIGIDAIQNDFDEASGDFQFASAVAQFAGILRESAYVYDDDFTAVSAVAGDHTDGEAERTEFLELVDKADALWNQ